MDKEKLPTPRQVLWWLYFEPYRLEDFDGKSLRNWGGVWLLVRTIICFVPYTIVCFYFCLALIAVFDLPSEFKTYFDPGILKGWDDSIGNNLGLLVRVTFTNFFKSLAGGLAWGLIWGLTWGLAFGLVGGLPGGLAGGLTFGLAVGLTGDFTMSLAGGLAGGVIESLALGLALGLAFGLAFGLAGGLTGGLAFGLAGGLVFGAINCLIGSYANNWSDGIFLGLSCGLGFIMSYHLFLFRPLKYLIYNLWYFFKPWNLIHNPFRYDGTLVLPVWNGQNSLIKTAQDHPEKGIEFAFFLLEKRPYNRKFAAKLFHGVNVGYLQQNPLDFQAIGEDVFDYFPKEQKRLRPSPEWIEAYVQIGQTRQRCVQESNPSIKLRYFKTFVDALEYFYKINAGSPPRWARDYLPAIQVWLNAIPAEQKRLEEDAFNHQPICENIYQEGEILDPERDQVIFLGREDLRAGFQAQVLSATRLPLFFIQGQRRVGKSSLIRFLPTFLDDGFTVVSIDAQSGFNTVLEFLSHLREQVEYEAGVWRKETPELPTDWLAAWKVVEQDIKNAVAQDGRRYILAIDEYEEFHQLLASDPVQGHKLLGALRSFSQHQKQVVFLFAGADYFHELQQPNWNEFFVQASLLEVDYLQPADTHKLLELVPLRYATGLVQQIAQDTQGHPALSQKIAHGLVAMANEDRRADISFEDYQSVLQNSIFKPSNGSIDLFWRQFCAQRHLQEEVMAIIKTGQPLSAAQARPLLTHRFVVQEAGRWRLRVPLFERWVLWEVEGHEF